MTPQELDSHLSFLKLDPAEAAQLLGVSARTLRRWSEGETIPAPAVAALQAWVKLDEWRIPWKPDAVSVFEDDQDQIARIREYATEVDAMIKRVEERGGPANPWLVDMDKCTASFGPIRVSFYRLANGSFSLSTYSHRGEEPDQRRDAAMIEDAAFSIFKTFKRTEQAYTALVALAGAIRKNRRFYAPPTVASPSTAERARQEALISEVADKIETLGETAKANRANYRDFQPLLDQLHHLGMFPEMPLISAVAHAFH